MPSSHFLSIQFSDTSGSVVNIVFLYSFGVLDSQDVFRSSCRTPYQCKHKQTLSRDYTRPDVHISIVDIITVGEIFSE